MADRIPHTIRFPKELHEALKQSAEEYQRSFNEHVVKACEFLIEDYPHPRIIHQDLDEMADTPVELFQTPEVLQSEKSIADIVTEKLSE